MLCVRVTYAGTKVLNRVNYTIARIIMELKKYFETAQGTGILSTADSEGNVDSAIYSRPHFFDDGTVAFIMADRLSHKNLLTNPRAAYLFIEEAKGYKGRRFTIKMIREEKNSDQIPALRRSTRKYSDEEEAEDKFLVFFEVVDERPLVSNE